MARGVGQSLRIFKAETAELRDGEKSSGEAAPAVEKGSADSSAATSTEDKTADKAAEESR